MVFDLIDKNIDKVMIFVCGASKFMPDQVCDAFKEVMGSYYNDKEKGIEIINNLIYKK